VNEEVYTASILEDIDLSTPDVIQASIAAPPAAQPKEQRNPRTQAIANENTEPKVS